MKAFYVILLCGVLSQSTSGDETQSKTLRQRKLVQTSFDYSRSPSAAATSKCGLVNVLVNETAIEALEQSWLQDSDIPHRISKAYAFGGYDKIFVCGNSCGKSESDTSSYRHMGCTVADASGVLANAAVIGWTNKTEAATVTETFSERIYYALDQTMANLPSSIEGIDLLDTCQQLDKKLVFVTHEYEELIDEALAESGITAVIANKGYILDAISQWTAESYVGTYVYN